jgi:hypothetical protein
MSLQELVAILASVRTYFCVPGTLNMKRFHALPARKRRNWRKSDASIYREKPN